MKGPDRMRYAFADCVLDTDSYTLIRAGEPVPVEPQVFDLLTLLAENAGKLVSRDAVVETVWNGRIVSEATIAARINAARRAVGDNGKDQAVIRTIPRRGIELTATVRTADPPAERTGAAPARQTIRYTTSADGSGIAFAVSGSGPPLLYASHHVSHLELDWTSPFWRPLFDRLGERHTLVRYDMRGTGLSDAGPPDVGIERHVEDMVAVADAAELGRVPVLATLNSAAAAVRLAVEAPDRISRMVLQEGYARGRAIRGAAPVDPANDPFVQLLKGGGWGDPANGYMRAWMSFATPGLTYDECSALIEHIGRAGPTGHMIQNRRTIDLYDIRDWLPAVGVPTLVIHARNDVLHPLEEGRILAAGIPGAEFLVVESGNTLCVPMDPTWDEQTRAILDFLERDDGAA